MQISCLPDSVSASSQIILTGGLSWGTTVSLNAQCPYGAFSARLDVVLTIPLLGQERRDQDQEKRERLQKTLLDGLQIVIDLGFDDLMTEPERWLPSLMFAPEGMDISNTRQLRHTCSCKQAVALGAEQPLLPLGMVSWPFESTRACSVQELEGLPAALVNCPSIEELGLPAPMHSQV